MSTETEKKPVSERVQDSIESKDQPLGETSPGAPFAIVALTYPLILTLVVGAIAFYYFVLR